MIKFTSVDQINLDNYDHVPLNGRYFINTSSEAILLYNAKNAFFQSVPGVSIVNNGVYYDPVAAAPRLVVFDDGVNSIIDPIASPNLFAYLIVEFKGLLLVTKGETRVTWISKAGEYKQFDVQHLGLHYGD